MKRYTLTTWIRDDQEVTVEFTLQPADDDVGITSPYVEDTTVCDTETQRDITQDLTQAELDHLENVCSEHAYEKQGEERDGVHAFEE